MYIAGNVTVQGVGRLIFSSTDTFMYIYNAISLLLEWPLVVAESN